MVDLEEVRAELKKPLALEGKKVLITGAGGGIGIGAAKACASIGADLVLSDILPEDQFRNRYAFLDRPFDYHVCSTAKRNEVEALAEKVRRIDALIDTAGICPFEDWRDPEWDASFDQVIDVNLRGPINLARAFMEPMKANGGGRIAVCGSVAGWTGGVRGGPHYAAAKGGLHAFLRWYAQHVGIHNITINAVAPGTTDTPMTQGQGYDPNYYPQKRFAQAEEIGATLTFLCTPAAGFMSGAILDINGGTYFH
jgi:NAD(P)-dependent dehydrogenase (short-subunit alcohol dehydrogenase family)